MTTVPEKVWPDAKVPYVFDLAIGESHITASIYNMYPIHALASLLIEGDN